MVKRGSTAKYLAVGYSNAAAAETLIKATLIDGGNTIINLGCLQITIPDDQEA